MNRTCALGLALGLLIGVSTALAADAKTAAAPPKTANGTATATAVRADENWDRPVLGFLRSPAMLLMTPEEQVAYRALTTLPRRKAFVEAFWNGLAPNCPPGKNPARDLVGGRAAEADEKFADEGVPGWLTDRGRVYVVLGAPTTQETSKAGSAEVLRWTWTGETPHKVLFVRDAQNWTFWTFAGLDAEPGAGEAPKPHALAPTLAPLAAQWRGRAACKLSPAEQAQANLLAWRKSLFDLAGAALGESKPQVAQPVEPSWYFFPADAGQTLAFLTVPLERPLDAGARLAAVLRAEGNDDATIGFGTDENPFEVRQVGETWVAQAVRVVPPGSYGFGVGIVGATGQVTPRAAGTQLVARLPKDSLRLASFIMAQQLKPVAAGDNKPHPFRLGQYEVVPLPSHVARQNETVTFVGLVLGALGDEPDVKVTYQLKANVPGKGWVNAGRPSVDEHHRGAVLAKDLTIPPQLPPQYDYKLAITVNDNAAAGASAAQDVAFKIRK